MIGERWSTEGNHGCKVGETDCDKLSVSAIHEMTDRRWQR